MCPKVDQKPKEQGKQTRNFQDIYGFDFKNKRAGCILSRMIRNKHKQRESPIQTITVEDEDSYKNKNEYCEEDNHIQYEFVSILLPFLQNREGFSCI